MLQKSSIDSPRSILKLERKFENTIDRRQNSTSSPTSFDEYYNYSPRGRTFSNTTSRKDLFIIDDYKKNID